MISKQTITALILVLNFSPCSGTASPCEEKIRSTLGQNTYTNNIRKRIAKERQYRTIEEKKKAGLPLTENEKKILAKGFPSSDPFVTQALNRERGERGKAMLLNYHENQRRFRQENNPLQRELFESFREIDPDLFPDGST